MNGQPWTDDKINYLKENYSLSTNKQLAKYLNFKLSTLRSKCYELGLKRIDLEYWTDEQVAFLVNNYRLMGDAEIAEILNYVDPKQKPWTLKHIEKKRLYLKLKRTALELTVIAKRNGENGCWNTCLQKGRITRGAISPAGTVKNWKGVLFIRTEKGYDLYRRYLWRKEFGRIAPKLNVVKIDPSKPEAIENLELLTDAELAIRNSKNRTPKELREAVKLLNQLNKKIYEKQNIRPKESHVRGA